MAGLRLHTLRSEPIEERWLLPAGLPPEPFGQDATDQECGLPPQLLAVL